MNVTLFPSQLSHKNQDFSGERFWGCSEICLQLPPEWQTGKNDAFGPKHRSLERSFDQAELLWAEAGSSAKAPAAPGNVLTQEALWEQGVCKQGHE